MNQKGKNLGKIKKQMKYATYIQMKGADGHLRLVGPNFPKLGDVIH